jgi:general secretion pathway protein D
VLFALAWGVSSLFASGLASAQEEQGDSEAKEAPTKPAAPKSAAERARERAEGRAGGSKPASRDNAPPDEPPGAAEPLPTAMETIQTAVDTPFKPKPGGHKVKFNLEDADLAELVNHISGLTGRRFIYGAKVRDIKVTVVSPTPVTLDEAYEAFISILSANGMTIVPHGRFLKIVDSRGIVTKAPPVYSRGTPVPDTDRMITRLYRLKYASAAEISKVLMKFKSKEGDITTYEEGQLLIITDNGTNIRTMIRLIEEIDLGGANSRMWIEPVYYSSAVDLAKQLNEIYDLKNKEGGGGLEKIIAEEQTNSLIVIGSEESYLRLLELIKRIDIAPAAEGDIHVLPLQHADADELAKTLTTMISGRTSKKSTKGTAPAQQVAEVFEGELRITADKPTNSLVISSSGHDFAQLRLVIEKLDQKRRQVFLEAVIMDVSIDRSSQLGLAYHGGVQNLVGDDSVVVGGFNPIKSIVPDASQLQALALGVRGQELDGTQNIPGLPTGVSIPAFGVFLNALAESGDSNVLSTPHIIATDNTEAEISVGENVPLQTNLGGSGGLGNLAGLAQAAGGAGGAGANLGGLLSGLGGGFSAQRTDVGTKIKITPHINDESQVRLEIQEEISETGPPVGALGVVSITKRVATTTVVVDDQQTVVIGGLMRDTKEQGRQKVPVLGDLPVLGFLFRNSTERMRKTNLLLILTPHVIRDQSDLRKVFQRKMQERQQFLDRFFVFSSEWSPPRDYSRANGLIEDIRQAFFDVAEYERLEAQSRPREERTHEPTESLDLAGEVNAGKGAGRKAAPKATPKAAPRKAAPKPAPRSGDLAPLRIEPVARSLDGAGDGDVLSVDRVE